MDLLKIVSVLSLLLTNCCITEGIMHLSYSGMADKRLHLPYHPVARIKGADARYASYNPPSTPFIPPFSTYFIPRENPENVKLSAGELLNLLAHSSAFRNADGNNIKGTMRFGIVR